MLSILKRTVTPALLLEQKGLELRAQFPIPVKRVAYGATAGTSGGSATALKQIKID
jgi:hypothetical protein